MNINKFDTASTGLNLELSAYADEHQSQHDFDESFRVIQHRNMQRHPILVFSMFGNINISDFDASHPSEYNLKSVTKADMIKHSLINIDDLNDNAKHYFSKHYNKLTKSELLECILDYCLYDDEKKERYLSETFTPTYAKIVSRGYCQGDYSEIYIPDEVIKEYKGQTIETIGEHLQSDIDHLLWDAPCYARLTVGENETEYYLHEFLNDAYSWDKDEIMSKMDVILDDRNKKEIDLIRKFLDDNLPETLDYL